MESQKGKREIFGSNFGVFSDRLLYAAANSTALIVNFPGGIFCFS